jgi:hypothetical protein
MLSTLLSFGSSSENIAPAMTSKNNGRCSTKSALFWWRSPSYPSQWPVALLLPSSSLNAQNMLGKWFVTHFWADFKFAHFENNDKMYSTGTWSYPVAKSILPSDAFILPIRLTYNVKSTETDSLWDLQIRTCANCARMVKGVHFEHSFPPVATTDNIQFMLCLGASQVKYAYILDILNTFQNTIEFNQIKRTYNTLPPFFVEYLRLRWYHHPDLPAVEQDPESYVIHNFCSMQGQKYVGHKFYNFSADNFATSVFIGAFRITALCVETTNV